jgi:hypothetical protein
MFLTSRHLTHKNSVKIEYDYCFGAFRSVNVKCHTRTRLRKLR